MTALIVIELDVKDAEALKDYGAQTPALLKAFGGELLLRGKPSVLHESQAADARYSTMVIFRFDTREQAEGWYNSPGYQALLPLRDRAMDSTFRLLA